MSKLVWDESGKKLYETGTSQVALFTKTGANGAYTSGVAWNGATGVTESPSGGEPSPLYADDVKYLSLMSNEEFGGTIEAYTYPDEFSVCDGSAEIQPGVKFGQQPRKEFGLAYKTILGNDANGNEYGYKLHIVYGALAKPSEKAYATVNDSPDAVKFSWEFSTTPVAVSGYKPVASITIDSTKIAQDKLTALENILYGTEGVDSRLPLPDEVATIVGAGSIAALTMTVVPADDATAVQTSANITLTFNNKIVHCSATLASAAGVKVEGTSTFDAAGKVLTLDPTTNLAASTTYVLVITGIMDVYGQTLADKVQNFATA